MPIVNIPALGNVQFPDDMPLDEIDRVIRQELQLKDKYGIGETIARGLERGVTSSIRGVGQIIGGGSATVPVEEQDAISQMQGTPLGENISSLATPGQIQKTDLQREAEFRTMAEQNPVAAYGSLIAGNIADPVNLLPIGQVKTAAQGLKALGAVGAISGAIEPVYGDDSRLVNTVFGAAVGGGLGAGFGALVNRFGRPAIEEASENLRKEGLPYLLGGTGKRVTDSTPATLAAEDSLRVAAAEDGQPIPPSTLNTQDSVPLMQLIEDAEKRTAIETDINNGNYTSFFTEVAERNLPIPSFRIDQVLNPNNPYYQQNVDAFLKAQKNRFEKSEASLEIMYKLFSTQFRGDLDPNQIRKVFTPEEAETFYKLRGREEVAPGEIVQAIIPIAQKARENLAIISELYADGIRNGMSRAELNEMFALDWQAIAPIYSSGLGSGSNAGYALNRQKALKAALGGVSPKDIRAFFQKQGKAEAESFGDLMDAIAAIKQSKDPFVNKDAAIDKLATDAAQNPKWNDKFGEFVVNSYISGVQTLSVNALSGLGKVGLLSIERAINALNPLSKVKMGELLPAYKGLLQGAIEGLYFAKEGFLRGAPLDADLTDVTGRRLAGAIGTSPDSTRAAQIAGEVIRTPGKVSVGIDEFFKSVFRRMELNGLAYRMAATGKYGDPDTVYQALKNVDTADKNWKQNIYSIPGISGLSDAAREALVKDVTRFAKQATFQADLGDFGRKIVAARAQHPGLAWVIPFVKTPINIMKDALTYTPAGLLMKEVVGYDAAGKAITKAIPGDVKAARAAMGVGMALAIGDLVASGDITGSLPRESGERAGAQASNIPEYSIRIGDKWVSYARLEPIATVLGSTVDGIKAVQTFINRRGYDDEAVGKLGVDIVSGITKNIASKTFLEGISGLLQAAHEPGRYGESFIRSFAGLVVPAFVAAPARSADPYSRVVTTFGEAIANRLPNVPGLGEALSTVTGGYIPGTREDLPVASNLFGGARPNPSYGLAAYTGLQITDAQRTALQEETARVKFDYELPKNLRGVELEGEDISKYQAISSQYADNILNRIIQAPAYQNAPDTLKRVILRNGMKQARAAATQVMLRDKLADPEFRTKFVRAQRVKKGLEEE